MHEQTTIVQLTDGDHFVAQTSAFRPWQIMPKLPVLCYDSNSGNVIIMLPEEAVLCSHYAELCNGI